jgi:putative DNA primase/helicase
LKMDAFTPRQVAVRGWGGLNTPDTVRKAANLLVDYGWLVCDVVRGGAAGGRPSEVYKINPAAFFGGAA